MKFFALRHLPVITRWVHSGSAVSMIDCSAFWKHEPMDFDDHLSYLIARKRGLSVIDLPWGKQWTLHGESEVSG